eukprot:9945447-Prorocentrum_lima.AAC.1
MPQRASLVSTTPNGCQFHVARSLKRLGHMMHKRGQAQMEATMRGEAALQALWKHKRTLVKGSRLHEVIRLQIAEATVFSILFDN